MSLLLFAATAAAQSLYKYQDEDGNWIYTDRAPDDAQSVEIRELDTGAKPTGVNVTSEAVDDAIEFVATNDYPVPVEIVMALDDLTNLQKPDPDQAMRWLVDANSTMKLLSLPAVDIAEDSTAQYRYIWIPGDPRRGHQPTEPYRVPFAVASDYPVSQAYPMAVTHNTPDARYAVDFAMPIGTDIYAARGGIVFEVASTNFRGGTDPARDAPRANVVRIMHDDGSQAVYAHLNWNSIRVERGEYIADSGNTGFTTGPHLHFAVLINSGMRLESVPVTFEGADGSPVTVKTGQRLVAY